MLLLTMHQWLGRKREYRDEPGGRLEPRESLISMATRLPLAEALSHVRRYEIAYREHYTTMACEFRLLQVSVIDDLDAEGLDNGRIELVERLRERAQDFE